MSMKCEDCNKEKLPLAQNGHDKKWRCMQCTRKFFRKFDAENIKRA